MIGSGCEFIHVGLHALYKPMLQVLEPEVANRSGRLDT